jgi:hypothetical protein
MNWEGSWEEAVVAELESPSPHFLGFVELFTRQLISAMLVALPARILAQHPWNAKLPTALYRRYKLCLSFVSAW